LGNSVKFTDRGSISLKIEPERENYYRFEVIGSGKGLSKDAQKLIFKPFQQGSEGLEKGGTGLGLAISKNQVKLMGGELDVKSEEGKGANSFIAKPYSIEDILDSITELLGVTYEEERVVVKKPEHSKIDFSEVRISEDMFLRLKKAAELYEITEIDKTLSEIEDLEGNSYIFAQCLKGFAEKYDMNGILNILEKVKP